jgi:hypothetical protein
MEASHEGGQRGIFEPVPIPRHEVYANSIYPSTTRDFISKVRTYGLAKAPLLSKFHVSKNCDSFPTLAFITIYSHFVFKAPIPERPLIASSSVLVSYKQAFFIHVELDCLCRKKMTSHALKTLSWIKNKLCIKVKMADEIDPSSFA